MAEQRHIDTWYCLDCDRSMELASKRKHLEGQSHAKKVRALALWNDEAAVLGLVSNNLHIDTWYCLECDRTMELASKRKHLEGRSHAKKIRALALRSVISNTPNHDTWYCPECDRTMQLGGKRDHQEGKPHAKKVRALALRTNEAAVLAEGSGSPHNDTWYCPECDITMQLASKSDHQAGEQHAKKIRELLQQKVRATVSNNPHPDTWYCPECDITMQLGGKRDHQEGKPHAKKIRALALRTDEAAVLAEGSGSPHNDTWYCPDCDTTMQLASKSDHQAGKQHAKKIRKLQNYQADALRLGPMEQRIGTWYCRECDRTMQLASKGDHEEGKEHLKRAKELELAEAPWNCPVCKLTVKQSEKLEHQDTHSLSLQLRGILTPMCESASSTSGASCHDDHESGPGRLQITVKTEQEDVNGADRSICSDSVESVDQKPQMPRSLFTQF